MPLYLTNLRYRSLLTLFIKETHTQTRFAPPKMRVETHETDELEIAQGAIVRAVRNVVH